VHVATQRQNAPPPLIDEIPLLAQPRQQVPVGVGGEQRLVDRSADLRLLDDLRGHRLDGAHLVGLGDDEPASRRDAILARDLFSAVAEPRRLLEVGVGALVLAHEIGPRDRQ
jgi:hypothetical protein